MEKGLFGVAHLFDVVVLRVLNLANDVENDFAISPEDARRMAKALTKAAKAVEKNAE